MHPNGLHVLADSVIKFLPLFYMSSPLRFLRSTFSHSGLMKVNIVCECSIEFTEPPESHSQSESGQSVLFTRL